MELRKVEAEKRGPALAALKKVIADAAAFVASEEECYEHIAAEERQKVTDAIAVAQKWLDENEAAQNAKAKTDPPHFMASAADAQVGPVQRVWRDVSSKPKPKPPPEEKPAEEEKPADAEEAAAPEEEAAPAAEAADMDVD